MKLALHPHAKQGAAKPDINFPRLAFCFTCLSVTSYLSTPSPAPHRRTQVPGSQPTGWLWLPRQLPGARLLTQPLMPTPHPGTKPCMRSLGLGVCGHTRREKGSDSAPSSQGGRLLLQGELC